MKVKILFNFLFGLLLSIAQLNAALGQAPSGTRILFIGNSLSFTHNMPQILEEISASFGYSVETLCICEPNYALIDHIDEGTYSVVLDTGQWTHVVMQQGPSSQRTGMAMLMDGSRQIGEDARAAGATPIMYMVWPSRAYSVNYPSVIGNYREASEQVGGGLWPVGEYWKAYEDRYEDYALYGPDGFHPSQAGAFFIALTMFHALYPEVELKSLPRKVYGEWATKQQFLRMVTILNH